jgi:hypothetical protein
MRLVRTITATCIVALIAGCATSRQASKDDESIVVTANRADESVTGKPYVDVPAPPPAPPPLVTSPSHVQGA